MEQVAKTTKRIEWIDTAKGLCLFLVIFGHLLTIGTWQNLKTAIYSFHMPMYFILAGWLMKPKDQKFLVFLKEKFFRLLLPAIVYLLICLPLAVKLQVDAGKSTTQILYLIFYYKGQLALNAPVWFLIAMFQILVFAKVIRLDKYNSWGKLAVSVVCFALTYVLYKVYRFPYFGIDRAILCMGFYSFGGVLKNICSKIKSKELVNFVCIICAMLWLLFSALMKQTPSIYLFRLDNFFYFLITGICGSVMWFKISSLLSDIRCLSKLGQNTLLILGSQYYWIYFVRKFCKDFLISGTYAGNWLSVLCTLVSMIFYYYITDSANKYFPFLNGNLYKNTYTKK